MAGPDCATLRAAAAADGLVLRDDAVSLAELDGLVVAWRGDGVRRPWLPAELGAYLGTVLVADLPTAGWAVGADGVPVVRQRDGHEIAVFAIAAARLDRPSADLRAVVREAHARPVRRRRWWQRR